MKKELLQNPTTFFQSDEIMIGDIQETKRHDKLWAQTHYLFSVFASAAGSSVQTNAIAAICRNIQFAARTQGWLPETQGLVAGALDQLSEFSEPIAKRLAHCLHLTATLKSCTARDGVEQAGYEQLALQMDIFRRPSGDLTLAALLAKPRL